MAITHKLEDLAKQLVELTVSEVNELTQVLKERYGIEPAAAAPVAATHAPAAEAAVQEKTSFDVVLKSAGGTKLAVIKEAKTITNLGLAEAKKLVDSAPTVLKAGVSKEEAETIKKKLEEVGAEIEIK